jgi:hypothetical protein
MFSVVGACIHFLLVPNIFLIVAVCHVLGFPVHMSMLFQVAECSGTSERHTYMLTYSAC